MTRSKLALSLYASLSWSLGIPAVFAQPLDRSQIQVIRDTAAFICNTVTEARGKKTALQIEGDIKAQLGGLVGKVTGASGLSGKGAMTIEEFEGLSRDATAAALQAAQGCRERVFNKMFDRLAQLSRPAAIRPPGNRAPPSSKTDGNGFVLNANGEKTCYTEMLYTPSVSGPNLISIPGKKIVKRCWHVSGAWVPDNVGPGQEPRQLPPRALNSDEIRTLVYIFQTNGIDQENAEKQLGYSHQFFQFYLDNLRSNQFINSDLTGISTRIGFLQITPAGRAFLINNKYVQQ